MNTRRWRQHHGPHDARNAVRVHSTASGTEKTGEQGGERGEQSESEKGDKEEISGKTGSDRRLNINLVASGVTRCYSTLRPTVDHHHGPA